MTTGIIPVTFHISMDEDAYELYEIVKMAPDGSGNRRMRYITVIRDDAPAQYVVDQGPATEGEEGVGIPSMLEHTVGELIDMAEALRSTAPAPKREMKENLVDGYFDIMEQQNRARHNAMPRIYS
jgi:hypothetical protein